LIISANFKSFKTGKSTETYLKKLNKNIANSTQEIIVFPPMTALQKSSQQIQVGTQNSYPISNGAFTGEIGIEQLDEFEIKTILIGHSERRDVLGENQDEVATKFKFFAKHNFRIIYCIGESLNIREKGESYLFKYLETQFKGIDLNYKNFVVAYEPIWAIGTGVTPTYQQITNSLNWLKNFTNHKVIYGGSVKLTNIEEILSIKSCDGVLVGSASLKVEDFSKMVKIADKIELN